MRTAKYRTDIQNIAAAYDRAPSADPKAEQAWIALAEDSKMRADHLRSKFDISETDDPEPYADAPEMFQHLNEGGFVVSRANSEHPIWTPDDNVNFRIAHDVLGHYPTGGDFSWNGENDACNAHAMKLADPAARKALMTECLGQTGFAIDRGGFGDQKVAFLEGYDDDPWAWQRESRVAAEDNPSCCYRNRWAGGWPAENLIENPPEEPRVSFTYSSVHEALLNPTVFEDDDDLELAIADEADADLRREEEEERKILEPRLEDFPDQRQWRVNVGETDAAKLVKWLHEYRPELIAPTADLEGMWEGEREPAGQAQVINASKDELLDLLTQYGFDHPEEEAVGVFPEGEGEKNTVLWSNPYNRVKVEKSAPPSPHKKIQLP